MRRPCAPPPARGRWEEGRRYMGRGLRTVTRVTPEARTLASSRTSGRTRVDVLAREPRSRKGRLLPGGHLDIAGSGGLAGREARGFHPERRAAHIVEPELVTEGNARRVTAVLTADAKVQLGVRCSPVLDRRTHERSYARAVDGDEGVRRNELAFLVHADELADVVAAEAERRLREIVRAEREELGRPGDLTGGDCRPRELDHRAPLEMAELDALAAEDLVRHRFELRAHLRQLWGCRDERDHDLSPRVSAFPLDEHSRLDDRTHLHRVEPGLDDAQTNSTEPEHR